MAKSHFKGTRRAPAVGLQTTEQMNDHADLVLRDPQDIEQNVDFSEVLQQARQQSNDFADAHRVTGELLKLEFCI